MEGLTALALLSFFIFILKNKEDLYQVPGITPLLLFLFYILFQLIPLPPFVVAFLSPDAFKIHQTTQMITDTNSWMMLTVHPKATVSEFLRYSTYVMFYILTVQLLSQKKMLQTTVLVITLFGGLLAFSSILQFYLTEDMALWFRHVPKNSIIVGPYVNHNHYAGLMELMFPIVLGLFLFYRPRIGNTSLIKGIAEIFSQEKANIHILIGTSALLIVVSIFVSLSRGAMISTCLSLILFTLLLLKRKISKGNTTLILGVIILTALSIGWFGWDQIFDRFARLKNAQGIIYESRLDFWQDSKEIIRHYKITGSGMGTFSHIYPLHRSMKTPLFLAHAHNDYLELLAEGGMIAFILAASFLITLFLKTYQMFLKRRDAFSIYLYMGSITALTSLLLHSFTDFNLHIGANGLWFFFVAGIAVCAANTNIRKQTPKTRLLIIDNTVKRMGSGLLLCMITVFVLLYNGSNLLGMFYYSNIKNYIMSTKTPVEILQKIETVATFASKFDPLHADYPFTIANTAWFLNDTGRSKNYFITSLFLDPLNSRHLNRFATFLALGNEPEKAEIAFQKSMVYDQSNPEYAFEYAAWLFTKNDIQQGIQYIKRALDLDEKYMDRALTAMIVSGIDAKSIELAIPDKPGPSIAFAGFLYDTGKTREAVDRYIASLDLIEKIKTTPASSQSQENQERIARSHFFKVYWFFKKHNDLQNAMQTMEKAEKMFPMDAGIKVSLGDLYYQQGILYKALDKYDHALLLEPGNKTALKMIKKINP
ncbi:MAG: O-antigen ligase family protein [Proteobacteria bacterium]|nr:O-antigen ligase family protein [Pseudomonadota bacterium]MBU2628749.1 O-antigen ligase family protein [Pseudomonadota bacterium]